MTESDSIEQLYHDVVNAFQGHADQAWAVREKSFHKYDGYQSYGLRAPIIHRILREFEEDFEQLQLDKRLELADKFYAAGIEEEGHAANFILSLSTVQLTPAHFKHIDRALDYFRSWSVTDSFCTGVLQPILLAHPDEIIRLLGIWNASINMWKRRASVVAFVRKVGESGEFTDICLRLCDELLWDEQDLVQKGVGWALKDSMRGDKEKVLEYVIGLRKKGVSSTITLYAIRDITGQERQTILKIRPE